MDNDKMMTFVLTLSDIAEGINNAIQAFKLIADGLDDVANILRDSIASNDTSKTN